MITMMAPVPATALSLLFVVVTLTTSLLFLPSSALIHQQLPSVISLSSNGVVDKTRTFPVNSHRNGIGRRRSRTESNNNNNNNNSNEIFRLYASTAPPKLDVIDSWKLMPDGRIKGFISPNGDNVLTSPLKNPNGLKEKATIQTVSGSQYRLGTPDATGPENSGANTGTGTTKLRADQLGTRSLLSAPTVSQERMLQNYAENKVRATMPLSSSSPSSLGGNDQVSEKKKNDFLTPLVGGASAVLIGAAIGTGVVSDKGISLGKLNDGMNIDPKELLKSSKNLNLPDIKSLKAPAIPIPSVSFPPNVKLPKLPNVGLQSISASGGIGMKMKNPVQLPLKSPNSNTETKQITTASVGQDPYRVPMPYLDQQVVEAENERLAQIEADKKKEAEMEAIAVQKEREEIEARRNAEQVAQIREVRQREEAALQRAQDEVRIRQEQEQRAMQAEEEVTRLREEIKQIRLTTTIEQEGRTVRAQEETARLRDEIEQIRLTAVAREKAAAEETSRLRTEAEEARLKEVAAKEELNRKLEEVKVAELKGSGDFTTKLVEAEKAAAKERILERELEEKRELVDEAASREAMIIEEVRQASIGAMSARKSSYTDSSLSTYEGWQERLREKNLERIGQQPGSDTELKIAAPFFSFGQNGGSGERMADTGTTDQVTKLDASSIAFDKNALWLSYNDWKQIASTPKVVSSSGEIVTAAAVTGIPAPLVNQLVSGKASLISAVVIGGLTLSLSYAYALQQNEEQVTVNENTRADPAQKTKLDSTPPPVQPSTPSVRVSAKPDKEKATLGPMATEMQSVSDGVSSIAKEISPPQQSSPTFEDASNLKSNADSINGSSNSLNGINEKVASNPVAADSQQVKSFVVNGDSYEKSSEFVPLGAQSKIETNQVSENNESQKGLSSGSRTKKSYSPFSTTKPKAFTKDTLYSPP